MLLLEMRIIFLSCKRPCEHIVMNGQHLWCCVYCMWGWLCSPQVVSRLRYVPAEDQSLAAAAKSSGSIKHLIRYNAFKYGDNTAFGLPTAVEVVAGGTVACEGWAERSAASRHCQISKIWQTLKQFCCQQVSPILSLLQETVTQPRLTCRWLRLQHLY